MQPQHSLSLQTVTHLGTDTDLEPNLQNIKIAMKLLLFTFLTVGNGGSRRSVCSAVRRQLSDAASRLVEVVVEISVMTVDWLANFSDCRVVIKLQESYEVIKSASKIWIRRFCDNLTTS